MYFFKSTPKGGSFRPPSVPAASRTSVLLFLVVCYPFDSAAADICRGKSADGLAARNLQAATMVSRESDLPYDDCGLAPLNTLLRSGKGGSAYIMRGKDQDYGEWPSFVTIVDETIQKPGVRCGGTLISDRHVLTAAHCFYRLADGRLYQTDLSRYKVRLADNYIRKKDPNEYAIGVKSACKGEYEAAVNGSVPKNDWAVLELSEPIYFSQYVQPACLPFAGQPTVIVGGRRALCHVVGAGLQARFKDRLQNTFTRFPKVIQRLPVTTVDCYDGLDHPTLFCYQAIEKEVIRKTCPGDSGGPLYCLNKAGRWTVVGVVVGSPVDCNPNTKGEATKSYFTNVPMLIEEIRRCIRF